MEAVTTTTLIFTILNMSSNMLLHMKFKHISCFCIESDCFKPTTTNTPIESQPIKRHRLFSLPIQPLTIDL
jgi:hypothetical protein